MRADDRKPNQLRPIHITRHFMKYAEGSALIEMGDTRVICTASAEERVPAFLKERGSGWITAEYSMIPRSTQTRTPRETLKGRQGGRTQEIQRLIGRSLRVVTDLSLLGERTIWIDCDVVQADGGTRTAAITGAFVALHDAVSELLRRGELETFPLKDFVAATSVGIVGGEILLDLTYEEDSSAEVDMNLVMTGSGQLVEIQGTAEKTTFSQTRMLKMIQVGKEGIAQLIRAQKKALGEK